LKSVKGNPFVFIEASSGTGKTQMAFNLMKYVEKRDLAYKILYIPCISGSSLQAIYRVFAQRSTAFQLCCKTDLRSFVTVGDSVSITDFQQPKLRLWSFGVIIEFIRQRYTFARH
jgi:Cdc6-like AAA superfamily ATPase